MVRHQNAQGRIACYLKQWQVAENGIPMLQFLILPCKMEECLLTVADEETHNRVRVGDTPCEVIMCGM